MEKYIPCLNSRSGPTELILLFSSPTTTFSQSVLLAGGVRSKSLRGGREGGKGSGRGGRRKSLRGGEVDGRKKA